MTEGSREFAIVEAADKAELERGWVITLPMERPSYHRHDSTGKTAGVFGAAMSLVGIWRRTTVVPFAVIALAGCASTTELRPFTTDGCSLFPDRSLAMHKDWCACCVAHDLLYWRGGVAQERLQADLTLRACVAQVSGDEALANLMYSGVRIGGTPYTLSWFRWGYGWGYGRFYRPLTDAERQLADRLQSDYLASQHADCAGSAPHKAVDATTSAMPTDSAATSRCP